MEKHALTTACIFLPQWPQRQELRICWEVEQLRLQSVAIWHASTTSGGLACGVTTQASLRLFVKP